MKEKIYKTRDLHEAGALWAQAEFQVFLERLEPTEKVGVFNFVFKCMCGADELESFLTRYINQNVQVEPRHYDEKLNSLRDRLRKVKLKTN